MTVRYWQNLSYGNEDYEIYDIFHPCTEGTLPLLIFLHGGSYVDGWKDDPNILQLCNWFALHGVVVANMEYYTLGHYPADWAERWSYLDDVHLEARKIWRSFIRFAGAARVDPERIFVGGCSGGAMISLHSCYSDIADPGGYQSCLLKPQIAGMIDLWGILSASDHYIISDEGINFFRPKDPPVCIVHGTADASIPYAGAVEINRQAQAAGVYSELHPLEGAIHGPFGLKDTWGPYVVDFMEKVAPAR